MDVKLEHINQAAETVKNLIINTPCDLSASCSKLVGAETFFKFENNQRTGSFKMRGAANKIASLSSDEKRRGVIACSAGNHAQGVALSATLTGVKSVIVMPETAPLSKVQATQNYGAEVILKGQSFDEAKEYAFQLAQEKAYAFVHPYEDAHVIAGQGTVGLEIYSQVDKLDTVIAPIGGGGLISGVAIALKSLKPDIRVIGVQTEAINTMFQLYKQSNYTLPSLTVATIADGIAIKAPSRLMFEKFISKYVDDIVTVTEGEVSEAIVFLLERAKSVAEGAGAAALAAVLSGKVNLGERNCVIVSGGNIDLNIVSQIIQRGQIQRGRLSEMSVIVPDVPGSLSQLTKILAEHKANILEVHHDRVKHGLGLKETKIDFVIETTGHDHIQRIRDALSQWGAKLQN